MSDLVQALGDALNRDLEALHRIAQNLANINTPGYKSISSNMSFINELSNVKNISQLNQKINQQVDLTDGGLKSTKRVLDIAITGKGFFVVSNSQEFFYTRNGSLSLDKDGVLVNAIGLPVITDNGKITITNLNRLKINANGEIYQGEDLLGKLTVVNFKNSSLVNIAGNGMLTSSKANTSNTADWNIHQGFIETSNVDSAQQVVKMMELSKHFESVQRALSIYDQALNSGINKIGQ